jgi:hypothetical protein
MLDNNIVNNSKNENLSVIDKGQDVFEKLIVSRNINFLHYSGENWLDELTWWQNVDVFQDVCEKDIIVVEQQKSVLSLVVKTNCKFFNC